MPEINLHFKSNPEQLTDFLKKIKDLITIDPRIIMKIDPFNMLLFSFVGDSFINIHAFKNYIFTNTDIMTIKGEIPESSIIFISRDGRKLYKTLENLLDYKDEIKGKISLNDEDYVNFMTFDNSKLNIKIIGNDSITIGKEISIDDINHLMDVENSSFNFRLDRTDFSKIRKMSLIDNEPKSVLYINVHNGKLSIGETKWHLNIVDIDIENITLAFPKKYFNTINPKDYIDVYVFESFILCKYDDYNLMIQMETTV